MANFIQPAFTRPLTARRQALRWGGVWMSWIEPDGTERTAAECYGRSMMPVGSIVTQISESRSIDHYVEYLTD